MDYLLVGIAVLLFLILMWHMTKLHFEDVAHGRVPGTEQSEEYLRWARENKRWYWPRGV
jgi:hypothetical protein